MIYVTLESIYCNAETDEDGADEPYVVVIAVNLRHTVDVPIAGVPGVSAIPFPSPIAHTLLYGPYEDIVKEDEQPTGFKPFWGLDGDERALADPDDVMFLVCMMENDDGDAELFRKIARFAMGGAIASSIGADRATLLERAGEALDVAASIPTGIPGFDERIGGLQELRFTPEELALAESGDMVRRRLGFLGDEGRYTLTFLARNRGQGAWRMCTHCRCMFWNGRTRPRARGTGRCPAAPDGHAPVTLGAKFFLPHEHAGPFGGEPGWRFCDRCFALFQAGTAGFQGVCPAGPGGHAFAQNGFHFFLPHDHNGFGQDEWRLCHRCQVLFWDAEPNKGVCAGTGAGHSPGGGPNFKLDFDFELFS